MRLIKDRLMEIFQKTCNDYKGLRYDKDLDNINHYNAIMAAGMERHIYKMMGCNMCMLNCTYTEKEAVLMIFSVPISEETGSKAIADRVMEIVENIEDCFVTVDYLCSTENKDDNFVYVTAIKSYDEH